MAACPRQRGAARRRPHSAACPLICVFALPHHRPDCCLLCAGVKPLQSSLSCGNLHLASRCDKVRQLDAARLHGGRFCRPGRAQLRSHMTAGLTAHAVYPGYNSCAAQLPPKSCSAYGGLCGTAHAAPAWRSAACGRSSTSGFCCCVLCCGCAGGGPRRGAAPYLCSVRYQTGQPRAAFAGLTGPRRRVSLGAAHSCRPACWHESTSTTRIDAWQQTSCRKQSFGRSGSMSAGCAGAWLG